MSDKTKEIIAMINYLGKHDSTLRIDLEDWPDYITYHYWLKDGNLVISPPASNLDKIKSRIHSHLIYKCQQKALNDAANIELANNNLFWCMKD